MKRSIKFSIISILVALMAVCLTMSFVGIKTTKADTLPTITSFKMYDGASIRKDAPTGIRFETGITQADKDQLPADAEFGTLIIPSELLAADTELTLETVKVAKVEAKKWLSDTTSSFGDTTLGYFGTLVGELDGDEYTDFAPEYFTKPFTARGYVKYNDGTSDKVIYTSNTVERAISGVADKAIADGDGSEYLQTIVDSSAKATLTFDTNGGSPISSQTEVAGYILTSADKPANPTKDNAEFVGWYSDQALTQEFSFSGLLKEDTTIYAKWNLLWASGTFTERHNDSAYAYVAEIETADGSTQNCLVLNQKDTNGDVMTRLNLNSLADKTLYDTVYIKMDYKLEVADSGTVGWILTHNGSTTVAIKDKFIADGEWHTALFETKVLTGNAAGTWGQSGSVGAPNIQFAFNVTTTAVMTIAETTVVEVTSMNTSVYSKSGRGTSSVQIIETDSGYQEALVLNRTTADNYTQIVNDEIKSKSGTFIFKMTYKVEGASIGFMGSAVTSGGLEHNFSSGVVSDGQWHTVKFRATVTTASSTGYFDAISSKAILLCFNSSGNTTVTISEIIIDDGFVFATKSGKGTSDSQLVSTPDGEKECLVLTRTTSDNYTQISSNEILNATGTIAIKMTYKVDGASIGFIGSAKTTGTLEHNFSSSVVSDGAWHTTYFYATITTASTGSYFDSTGYKSILLCFSSSGSTTITISEFSIFDGMVSTTKSTRGTSESQVCDTPDGQKECLVLGRTTADNYTQIVTADTIKKSGTVTVIMTYKMDLGSGSSFGFMGSAKTTGGLEHNFSSSVVADGEWHTVSFTATITKVSSSGSYFDAFNYNAVLICFNTSGSSTLTISNITIA